MNSLLMMVFYAGEAGDYSITKAGCIGDVTLYSRTGVEWGYC
jgi:hypothetical protein